MQREVRWVHDEEREVSEERETGPAKNLRLRSWGQKEETMKRRWSAKAVVFAVAEVVGSGGKRREREERKG